MAFKKLNKGSASLETPESLLHDLRTKKIKGPLAHQADMWRSYTNDALKAKDVALQLPTGSGKTLVGLIIAEWRRRKFQEKVVYLCPTNQLVNQVVEQARDKYGLTVGNFTGSKHDYSQTDKTDYQLANLVAVTTYSALFNVNPFFKDPDVIIFDDAHASDNYVSKFWTLEISRFDYKSLFECISLILKEHISSSNYSKLTVNDKDGNNSWVDKLPTPILYKISEELSLLIDEESNDNKLRFSWSMIRDHLMSCHLYYSRDMILIRPLISPTNTHLPFYNAKQRIYMSATLGKGGDLERIVGRKKILSLPIPSGWDQQGIGRRFFVFPETSLTKDEYTKFFLDIIEKNERSLFLTTNQASAKYIGEGVKSNTSCTIFNAKEIEETKDSFITNKHAIAIIANRYDGIDFPDDECRILIIHGLPTATNLQERFFTSRMGARIILNERILTRIIQAIGRCTRSSTDYSAVIIYGEELLSYLLSPKRRRYLHPELQAELEFGIEQSKGESVETLHENLDLFLSQNDDWLEADESIVEQRNALYQQDLPCIEQLSNSVSSEILYQYYLWDGDYSAARNKAMEVLSVIKDGDLTGYRSLWNYLAGSTCWLDGKKHNPAMIDMAKKYYSEAKKAVIGLHWLVDLTKQTGTEDSGDSTSLDEVSGVIEKLELNIVKLGYMNNQNYNKHNLTIMEGIESDSSSFEESQVLLGELLGFKAGNSNEQGAPDPWWILRDDLCIVFEDHNDAKETSKLSIEKARQAFCHNSWIKENIHLSENAEIIKVLVTPVTKTQIGATTFLKGVCLWNLDEYKLWVKDCLGILRELRSSFPGEGDMVWRSEAMKIYHDNNLTPTLLTKKIKTVKANKALTEQ